MRKFTTAILGAMVLTAALGATAASAKCPPSRRDLVRNYPTAAEQKAACGYANVVYLGPSIDC